MGWGADVHAGVVENQIFEVDEFACEPQTGAGVGIMGARDPAIADRAFRQTLVEPGERIFGSGEWAGELGPGQRIGDLVAGWQGLDNLNRNHRDGSYHALGFRHSEAAQTTCVTIDNYLLSIR